MESLKVINKRLMEKYGKAIDGRPNFRVVFSDTQYENRYEDFVVHLGEIYLKETREYRYCKKYEYIKGKHVLEELKFFDYGAFPDRPFIRDSYEPLWTFMDKDKNPLYPIWQAVEHVVECKLNGIRETIKRNFKAEEQAQLDADIKEMDEILGVDEGSVLDMNNQYVNFVKPVFLNGPIFKG